MRDWESYRERFVRDPLPIRLGGIAANLARITSFSSHDHKSDTVREMLEDSKYLIEWTAPVADLDTQVELLELERLLTRWYYTWQPIWNDIVRRRAIEKEASRWSDHLLDLSGLLNEETYEKYNIPKR